GPVLVPVGVLPEGLRISLEVEQVVRDLKSQAQVPGIEGQRLERRLARSPRESAPPHGRNEERAGLAGMDRFEIVEARRGRLRGEVRGLTPAAARRARGRGELARDPGS